MINQTLRVGTNLLEIMAAVHKTAGGDVDSGAVITNFQCSLLVADGTFGTMTQPTPGNFAFDRSPGVAGDVGVFSYSAIVTIPDPDEVGAFISAVKNNDTQVTLTADPLAPETIEISFR